VQVRAEEFEEITFALSHVSEEDPQCRLVVLARDVASPAAAGT